LQNDIFDEFLKYNLMNFQLFEKMLMQMFKTHLIVDDLKCYNDVVFIISFHKWHFDILSLASYISSSCRCYIITINLKQN